MEIYIIDQIAHEKTIVNPMIRSTIATIYRTMRQDIKDGNVFDLDTFFEKTKNLLLKTESNDRIYVK